MGWKVNTAKNKYHSANKFTGSESLVIDEWTRELLGEQYDAEIQTISWNFELKENTASLIQAEKVSYN